MFNGNGAFEYQKTHVESSSFKPAEEDPIRIIFDHLDPEKTYYMVSNFRFPKNSIQVGYSCEDGLGFPTWTYLKDINTNIGFAGGIVGVGGVGNNTNLGSIRFAVATAFHREAWMVYKDDFLHFKSLWEDINTQDYLYPTIEEQVNFDLYEVDKNWKLYTKK